MDKRAKKRMRSKGLNILILIAAVMLIVLMPGCSDTGVDEDGLARSYRGKTVILSTNDVHGNLSGYQYVAGLKEELEDRGAEVLLVDCGDYSQGEIYAGEYKGMSVIDIMNLCGYNYATLGNHEFDYGIDILNRNIRNADFEVLCSDVLDNSTGEPVYGSGTLYEDDDSDLKIGLFGMDTPETQTKSSPGNFRDMHFATGDEFYEIAQNEADSLRESGADLVICIAHLGVNDHSAPYRSTDLYEKTQGIDYILDGHSHTVMDQGEEGEPVISTGTLFQNIGVTVIDEKTESVENHFLYEVSEDSYSEENVRAAAQKYIDDTDRMYSEKIAECTVSFNGIPGKVDDPGNRNSETNTGDFVADAFRWYILHQGADLGVPDRNVIAIMNGAGIRKAIPEGDVTREDIWGALPYNNTLSAVTVKGSQLLEVLEASTYCLPDAVNGFPQVSGIEFTINTGEEYAASEETYPGSTYYAPAEIRRVTIDNVNGEAFDPEADYVLLLQDFLADGGDTYYVLTEASERIDTGISIQYAVIEYIMDALDGHIDETYSEPKGRIHIN